jgi:predicted nucleic acid-binding protein
MLAGQSKLKGKTLTMADGIILATTFEHDLVLVTRNVKDFAGYGASVSNPWEA